MLHIFLWGVFLFFACVGAFFFLCFLIVFIGWVFGFADFHKIISTHDANSEWRRALGKITHVDQIDHRVYLIIEKYDHPYWDLIENKEVVPLTIRPFTDWSYFRIN